jgi:hypothetical protein
MPGQKPGLDTLSGRSFWAGGMLLALGFASAKLVLHCVFNNRYGYFRDEFDYLACGNHLAWGYVDQPPLIPFLARVSRLVLGDSLRSVRFVAALASSAVILVAAMIARELGGRAFAIALTATTILIAPIFLSDGSLFTTNCLEPILWTVCIYFATVAIKRNEPRFFLWFGVVAGIGLEEKYSIAVLGLGIVVGLLLTQERRAFATRWIWLGGALSFLIFLPNLLWNVHHDWPFGQLMANIRASGRDVRVPPLEYLARQVLLVHPLSTPVWITGLVALLFSARFKTYRFLGIAYVTAFIVFTTCKGKDYYLTPIYPALLAAGAVVIEGAVARKGLRWTKPALLTVLFLGGGWLAPITVPMLSVDHFITYMNALPFSIPRSEKSHLRALLPQHYADQFGWEEMVAVVGQAWALVPPEERHDCGIFAQDYGQAGAVDFFGRRYGLPPALSGHQTYFLWGPRGYSGNCLIVLDDTREALERLFEQVAYVGTSDNPYALEREIPVFLCRGPRFGTLADLWPRTKKWD